MSVRHPVPDEVLLDYAVGSTGAGKSLLVATHLAMCQESWERFALLQEVGGEFLDSLDGGRLERISAESVLARADAVASSTADLQGSPVVGRPAKDPTLDGKLGDIVLPRPLAAFADEIQDQTSWRKLGLGIEAALLSCSVPGGRTQILRARRGAKIVRHTHIGEEMVLILKGAFWDGAERFGPGDVAVNDAATTHAPVIEDAEDCLCLAVTEGPIKFVGPLGWLLNRFNRF